MRILTLIHEYPPVGGGGGRVAQDICRGLVKRGHAVQVLTAHWGDLPEKEDQDGVLIYRLRSLRRLPYKAGLVAMLGFVLASFWVGLRQVHRWKPDVIHVHFAVPAGAAAWLLSRLAGVPYVLTAHLGDVPGGVPEKTSGWFKWLYPFTPPIWKNAAQVTAVSDFTRGLALAHYPVKIQVIPNGVNVDELDPGVIQVNTPPSIVFAGRFVAQKNPLQVVHTLAKLKDLPWKCVMLGDGVLRHDLEAEIAAQGLQERFELPGWVEPGQVIARYAKSDILLLPSLSEGFPVVGVQAMGMGLALVLSQIGGCVDLVISGENGFLVDLQEAGGFEKALRALLSDRSLLLKCRLASRRMAPRFNLEQVITAYEASLLSASQTARGNRGGVRL